MLVNHRRADHAIAAEQDRNLLLVHVGRNLAKVAFHDLADAARARRAEQPAKADFPDRVARRVNHENQIELRVAEARAPQKIDGPANGPERRHGDNLALHHPAGGILRIGEAFLDQHAVLGGQGCQDIVNLVLLQLFNDVDRIIGFKVGELARKRLHPHDIDNLVAGILVKIGQCFRIKAVAKNAHQLGRPERRQPFQKVSLVSRVQRREKRPRAVFGPGADGSHNGRFNLRRQPIERGKTIAVIALLDGFRLGLRLLSILMFRCRHVAAPNVARDDLTSSPARRSGAKGP